MTEINATPEQISELSKHLIEYIYTRLKPFGVDISQYLDTLDRPLCALSFEDVLKEFLETVCFGTEEPDDDDDPIVFYDSEDGAIRGSHVKRLAEDVERARGDRHAPNS